ncbi:hemocyanin-like 1 (Hcl-1) [Biomphalaria glabrata]
MTGDEVTGDEVTGDEMTGDVVTGDEVTGDEVTGDEMTGDVVTGDEVTGDEMTGHRLGHTWTEQRPLGITSIIADAYSNMFIVPTLKNAIQMCSTSGPFLRCQMYQCLKIFGLHFIRSPCEIKRQLCSDGVFLALSYVLRLSRLTQDRIWTSELICKKLVHHLSHTFPCVATHLYEI